MNDHVNNTVKQIKNYFWGQIKTSIYRLCDWFKLYEALTDVFGKLKEQLEENISFGQRQKTTKRIMEEINSTTDRHLASKGI